MSQFQVYKPGGQRCNWKADWLMLDTAAIRSPGKFVTIPIPRNYTKRRVYAWYHVNDTNVGRIYDVSLDAFIGNDSVFSIPCRKIYQSPGDVGNGNAYVDCSGTFASSGDLVVTAVQMIGANFIQIQNQVGTFWRLAPLEINTEADSLSLILNQPFGNPTVLIVSYFLGCYSEN